MWVEKAAEKTFCWVSGFLGGPGGPLGALGAVSWWTGLVGPAPVLVATALQGLGLSLEAR